MTDADEKRLFENMTEPLIAEPPTSSAALPQRPNSRRLARRAR
jgi:hypothetical protein